MIKINKKFSFKTCWNIFYGIVFVFLLFMAAVVTLSMFDIPGGFKLYTVQSGSMEPTIKTGSLIISKPVDDYQVGDIITFKSPKDSGVKNPLVTTTHRIAEKKDGEGKISFVTKGDANNVADMESVSENLVLGKTIFSIPFLGYPVSLAKTQSGLIIFIVIPATIIIYSELLSIKKESIRLIKERRIRKLTPLENIEEKIGEEIIEVESDVKKLITKPKKIKKRK